MASAQMHPSSSGSKELPVSETRFVDTAAGKVPVEQWHQWKGLASAAVKTDGNTKSDIASGLMLHMQLQNWQKQQNSTQAQKPLLGSQSHPSAPSPWEPNNVLHQLLSEAVQLAKLPEKQSTSGDRSRENGPGLSEYQEWDASPEAFDGESGTGAHARGAGDDGDADGSYGGDGDEYSNIADDLVREVLDMRLKLDELGSENEQLKRQLKNQKMLMEQMQESLLNQGDEDVRGPAPHSSDTSRSAAEGADAPLAPGPEIDLLGSRSLPPIPPASDTASSASGAAAASAAAQAADAGASGSSPASSMSTQTFHAAAAVNGTAVPGQYGFSRSEPCSSTVSPQASAHAVPQYNPQYSMQHYPPHGQPLPPFYHQASLPSNPAALVQQQQHMHYLQNQQQQYAADAARMQQQQYAPGLHAPPTHAPSGAAPPPSSRFDAFRIAPPPEDHRRAYSVPSGAPPGGATTGYWAAAPAWQQQQPLPGWQPGHAPQRHAPSPAGPPPLWRSVSHSMPPTVNPVLPHVHYPVQGVPVPGQQPPPQHLRQQSARTSSVNELPWSCQACTYLHEGAEAVFLRCKICTALK